MGRYEEALIYIDRALAIEPRDVNTLNNKGIALADLGRHEEAINCYDKILAIEPYHIGALNNKGIALADLGRHEEAIRYYDKVIEIHPDLAIVREKRDLSYKQLENPANSPRYGKPEKSRWKRLFGK